MVVKGKYLIINLLIIFFVAGSTNSYCNYSFQHISINDGLSQGTIRAIYKDKKGFMWFGTNDGLNRYDGYQFKIYRNENNDNKTLSDNFIYGITSSDNDLWIATSKGLNRYNRLKDVFENYYPDNSDQNSIKNWVFTVTATNYNKESFIWLLNNEGLIKFTPKSKKFTLIKIPNTGNPNRRRIRDENFIIDDKKGHLYIIYKSEGIFKYDIKAETFSEIKIRNDLIKNTKGLQYNCCILADNNLWVGTSEGLFLINVKENLQKNVILEDYSDGITALTLENNNLWIGTSHYGVFILNTVDFGIKHIRNITNESQQSSFTEIYSLFSDINNIVWIGSNGSGLAKYSRFRNKFRNITTLSTKVQAFDNEILINKSIFPINSVRSFYEDENKLLWVSTYDNRVLFYDLTKERFIKYPYNYEFQNTGTIYSFAEDKQNPDEILWIGTEGIGLFKFNKKTESFQSVNELEKDLRIFSILSDDNGDLLIGTQFGLLLYNPKTKKKFEYNLNHNKSDTNITDDDGYSVTRIYKDSKNNYWVGTNFGGLFLFDKSRGFIKSYRNQVNNPNSLSNNFIKSINEDSGGRLWIGTNGGGLNQFDYMNEKFKSLTTRNGLPNNVIYAILEDQSKNLWLSTNFGLSCYNPDKKSFRNYTISDGLQSNEFNTNAYLKTKSGDLMFGGVRGFNIIKSDNISINENKPAVVITGIEINSIPLKIGDSRHNKIILEKSIEETNEIRLYHEDRNIKFSFAAMDFVQPKRNSYAFILKGFEKNWRFTKDNNVTYTNLDPGDYEFIIRSCNNDGVWSDKETNLKISIIPPFYRTNIFRIIALILIIVAIFIFMRFRDKSIIDQNRKLEQLVKQRTLELEYTMLTLSDSEKNLKNLNITKDKFFSIIAHDLKNPLSSMISTSDMIAKNYDLLSNTDIIEIAEGYNKSALNLYNLLDNLLTWSRSQRGTIKFNPSKVNLYEMVNIIFHLLGTNANIKEITLVNCLQKDVIIFADENMINTILRNLLSNAVKFTKVGGTVTVNCDIETETDFNIISIHDTGIGIEQQNINKLFRIDMSYTTSGTGHERGTGLGLIICKEFVEKHKGKIWVESTPEVGTTFFFTIPKIEKVLFPDNDLS